MICFRILTSVASAALVALLSSAWTAPAQAGVITYTASGSNHSDGSVSASATFTTSNNEIDITLTDTLAASLFKDQGQALSGLSFTLSNAPGTEGSLSATGQLADINSSTGTVTYVSGEPTRWIGEGTGGTGTFSVSGKTITLGSTGGGQPSEMITPNIANGAAFNGPVGGIDNFNPYSIGTVNLVLVFMGVTSSTTVTAANFAFGTGPDITIPGTPRRVPEPLTLSVFSAGLAGAAALRRRKKP